MRAKTLNENISFQRDRGSKRSLDIGMTPDELSLEGRTKIREILKERGIPHNSTNSYYSFSDNKSLYITRISGIDLYDSGDYCIAYSSIDLQNEMKVNTMDPFTRRVKPGWNMAFKKTNEVWEIDDPNRITFFGEMDMDKVLNIILISRKKYLENKMKTLQEAIQKLGL